MKLALPSRVVCLLMAGTVLFTHTRCASYQRVSIAPEKVFADSTFKHTAHRYRVILTDPEFTYELRNPQILEGSISGTPEILSPETATEVKNANGYHEKRRDRNCVFMNTSVQLAKKDTAGKILPLDRIVLNSSSVFGIDGYAVDPGETFVRTLALVGGGAIIMAFAIIVRNDINRQAENSCLFCSDSDNTEDTNDGSDSGESDSGDSDSDSGDSDSGSGG